jgi:hypothetical protein
MVRFSTLRVAVVNVVAGFLFCLLGVCRELVGV